MICIVLGAIKLNIQEISELKIERLETYLKINLDQK